MGNCIDMIQSLLGNQTDCKMLCVTEHWMSAMELRETLGNLKLVSSLCRDHGRHGGAAVYIHPSIRSKRRKQLEELSIIGQFECAAAEVFVGKRSIVVLSVYRPNGSDSDVDIFLQQMEKALNVVFAENKFMIVAGDFNIDLLDNTCKHRIDF